MAMELHRRFLFTNLSKIYFPKGEPTVIDLDSLSKDELVRLKSDVEKAIQSAEKRALQDARRAAEKAAAEFGFKLEELTGGEKTRAASPKKAGVAKYRNPQDPDQTWTGKGRQPQWFKDELAKGTDPAKLEI